MRRLFFFIGLSLLLAGGMVFFLQINKSHPDWAELPADVTLSAAELYQQYSTDPKTTDSLYLDKIIQIEGVVNDVEYADSVYTAVFAFREGMFGDEGIRCVFLKLNDFELQKGDQPMKIKGVCRGYNLTDVILEKCILQP